MAGPSFWVDVNWFNVVQTVGVIGSLCFTATTVRNDTKARREETKARAVSNIIALSQRHREIWAGTYQPDDLKRIMLEEIDLTAKPATMAEIEYLRGRAVDFEDGWRIALINEPEVLDLLALDAAEFFALPLPRFVWEKAKQFRNPKFVKFVERAMTGDKRPNC